MTKVHLEALRYARDGYEILLIGHRGHVEVIGTLGHAPDRMHLVETVEDVARVAGARSRARRRGDADDAVGGRHARHRRGHPPRASRAVRTPAKDDICYATQNRQTAVKELARQSDCVLVIGSPTSSNANRLVEVARNDGDARRA